MLPTRLQALILPVESDRATRPRRDDRLHHGAIVRRPCGRLPVRRSQPRRAGRARSRDRNRAACRVVASAFTEKRSPVAAEPSDCDVARRCDRAACPGRDDERNRHDIGWLPGAGACRSACGLRQCRSRGCNGDEAAVFADVVTKSIRLRPRIAVGTTVTSSPPHGSQRARQRTGLFPWVLASKRTFGQG